MLKIFVSCNERQNLIKLEPPLTSAVKNIFYESICFYREINYYCSGERYFTGTSVLREIPLEISSGCRINIVGFARSLFFFFFFFRVHNARALWNLALLRVSRERHTRVISGFSGRVRRGCVVACKSRDVDVHQSARDLIYGRITSQRSAEMALRHSLSATRSSSLNCVRFIPRTPPPPLASLRPVGVAVEFPKKIWRILFRRIYPEIDRRSRNC